eukprot:PhM_4_TR1165/c0_g1_i1/m.83106
MSDTLEPPTFIEGTSSTMTDDADQASASASASSSTQMLHLRTRVTANNSKLYDVLQHVLARLEVLDQAQMGMKADIRSLSQRACTLDEKVQLFMPDADVEAAKNKRIENIESEIAALKENYILVCERGMSTEALLARVKDSLDSEIDTLKKRVGIQEARVIPDVTPLNKGLKEVRALIGNLETAQLGARADIKATRAEMVSFQQVVSEQIAAVTSVFCLPDPEQLCETVRSMSGTAERVDFIHRLPWMVSFDERLLRERKMFESNVMSRLTNIAERVKEKADQAEFRDHREVTEAFNKDVGHWMGSTRHQIDVIMETKADREELDRNVEDLVRSKADRTDIVSKLGPQELRRIFSEIETVREDVMAVRDKALKSSRPAIRAAASGGDSSADTDALRRAIAELQKATRGLEERKADKSELFDLHDFVQKMLRQHKAVLQSGDKGDAVVEDEAVAWLPSVVVGQSMTPRPRPPNVPSHSPIVRDPTSGGVMPSTAILPTFTPRPVPSVTTQKMLPEAPLSQPAIASVASSLSRPLSAASPIVINKGLAMAAPSATPKDSPTSASSQD